MKLSVSINFFNGEETLFQAVKCIRPYVDHLSIVYQEVSNHGHPISTEALNILEQLKTRNLVDDWIKYQPDLSLPATKNEFLKRHEGLRIARYVQATHFLLMDADEFYLPSEFESAKKIIEETNIDYSCVHSYFYVHKPTYRSLCVDTTNVCFIAKISDKLLFDHGGEFPVASVDPTRRISVPEGKFKFFDEHEICMHHMNFVRRDFTSKLLNTSSAADQSFINQARHSLMSWQYPATFSFPNKPSYQIIETENLFNLSESIYKGVFLPNPLGNSKDKRQKNILICTLWLRGLTGSEIATYEIASWFADHEWKVFVFTSEFENPIAQEFQTLGSNVLVFTDQTDPELINIYPHLDFCWIHHQHLPGSFIDFLRDGGEKPWIAFNHMSPYEQLEYPVVLAAEKKLADVILCNSQETLDALRSYFIDCIDKVKLFQNPAPAEFASSIQKHDETHSLRLNRVAIVSNHPPAELKEAALLLQKNNVLVNFIGTNQDLAARVTPSLLNNYDVIITIGKTVQYGLAMKKPIYIYDHFGGEGYLSKDNFRNCELHNFSGRFSERKTAEQIVCEVIGRYTEARNFAEDLDHSQLKRFLLNDQLQELLNQNIGYQKSSITAKQFTEIHLIKAYSRNLSILWTSNALNRTVAELNEEITHLNELVVERNEQIAERTKEIAALYNSTSWRVTSPLRMAMQLRIRYTETRLPWALRGVARNIWSKFSRVSTTVKYFQEQPEALRGYVLYARKLGVIETFRHAVAFIIRGGPRQAPMPTAVRHKILLRRSSEQPTVILTTLHCLYIAQAISAALSRVGVQSQIIHERPPHGYSDDAHFVICPHMFAQLPRFYFALQMEQSVSSRWFTNEYLRILESSLAILDYSTVNISFLKLKGLSLRQIYYLPIDYLPDYEPELEHIEEHYDVIFYGDINITRRQKFLCELKKHFRVKVINNLFGAPLHSALASARIVVNIHYYAGALLETTRIWECLSLNKLVISERSSDMDHHANLIQLVDFVDIDDVSGMVERVRYWLDNDSLRGQRISENRLLLQQQPNRFDYFFYRFLLATDNITFEEFWHQVGQKSKLPSDAICLTLPEYVERTAEFNKDNYFGFSCFPGLRHTQSWLGCAMSYKFMIMLARQQRLSKVTICEDDVEFPADFAARWRDIQHHLSNQNLNWDIFSGLMADLSKDARILETHIHQGHHFVTIDKLISTVFNVYNQRIFDTIAQWDETNRDVTTNTIDRYLESYGAIKVLTTIPFLVGHKESQESTLWGIQNSEYTDLIVTSSQLLKEKMRTYNSGSTPL